MNLGGINSEKLSIPKKIYPSVIINITTEGYNKVH